jgi:hypothetical protein
MTGPLAHSDQGNCQGYEQPERLAAVLAHGRAGVVEFNTKLFAAIAAAGRGDSFDE